MTISIQELRDQDARRCPYCQSESVSSDKLRYSQWPESSVYKEMFCFICYGSWAVYYRLDYYKNLNLPENPDI